MREKLCNKLYSKYVTVGLPDCKWKIIIEYLLIVENNYVL